MDMAIFYDAGKVASRLEDLDFNDMTDNWGIGARFHGLDHDLPAHRDGKRIRGLELRLRQHSAF